MIIDASVLLSAFFPDEAQAQAQAILHSHAAGSIGLKAPQLVVYEVTNAVWQAERRGRISAAQVDEILRTIAGLDIELLPLDWGGMLPLARQYDRSVYDAAYLTLAQQKSEPLVTGDKRMYNAVRGKLDWVIWIGDFAIGS